MLRGQRSKRRWALSHLRHVRSRFRKDRLIDALLSSGVAKIRRTRPRPLRPQSLEKPRRTEIRERSTRAPEWARPEHHQSGALLASSDLLEREPVPKTLCETRTSPPVDTSPAHDRSIASAKPSVVKSEPRHKRVLTPGNVTPDFSPQMKRLRFEEPLKQPKRPKATKALAQFDAGPKSGGYAGDSIAQTPKPRSVSETPKLEGGFRGHHQEHLHDRKQDEKHRHDSKHRTVSLPLGHARHEQHVRPTDAGHSRNKTPGIGEVKPHSSTSSWPSRIGKPQLKGLSNPGLWCYRRSVMQALLRLPQFCRVLEYHDTCKGACVTCALSQVLEAYHTGDGLRRQVQTLDKVIASTGRRSDPPWKHTGQSQEDAHMFLQYLVGSVETARGIPKERFRHALLIQHVASWTCQGCKKVHTHMDPPSCSLQLPIAQSRDKQTTLEHCLNSYHKEEDLTIRCDGCKSNRPRMRQHKIKHPPEVLMIQLKRFQTSFTGRGVQKNSRRVKIDPTLDLAPWCAGEKKSRPYRLQAVVAHSGSLNMGHYVAYVRHQDQIKLVNDDSVSAVPSSEWTSPRAYDPYILVYTRS